MPPMTCPKCGGPGYVNVLFNYSIFKCNDPKCEGSQKEPQQNFTYTQADFEADARILEGDDFYYPEQEDW